MVKNIGMFAPKNSEENLNCVMNSDFHRMYLFEQFNDQFFLSNVNVKNIRFRRGPKIQKELIL